MGSSAGESLWSGRGAGRVVATLVLHALLIALAFLALLPFLWLICASFKSERDIFDSALLPWGHLDRLTLDNFHRLFRAEPFGHWLANSVFLASGQTVGVVIVSSLTGYVLAKHRFRGRRLLMGGMLATMLMPGVVLLPSSWLLMYKLGWLDSYAALLIPGAVSAFGAFLFMQAMKQVPDELLEAARIDGCGELRLWWEIALPIVRPMTGAFTLLAFIAAWNAYLWPSVVLQDQARYTLPLGLASMAGLPEFSAHYGVLMAATLLSILPAAGLFFALQRDFVAGLTAGSVKG